MTRELPDDWSDAGMLAGQPPPPGLAAEMRRTWAQFARSGLPAGPLQLPR